MPGKAGWAALAVALALARPAAAQDGVDPSDSGDIARAEPGIVEPASAVSAPAASAAVGPVDPYRRDGGVAAAPPNEARGWETPPQKGRRPALVRWVVGGTGQGLRWLLRTSFAPIKGAIRLNKRYKILRRTEDFFYNEARTAAILPDVAFVSGLGLSFGVQAFHRDLLGNDEQLRFKALRGGAFNQSIQLGLDVPRVFGSRFYLDSLVRFEENPNLIFVGLGRSDGVSARPPDLAEPINPRDAAFETRFRQRRTLLSLASGINLGSAERRFRIGASAVANFREIGGLSSDERADQVSLDDVYDPALLAGFADRFGLLELTLDFSIDTRDSPGATSRGWLIEGFVGGAPRLGDYGFGHWGLEGTIFQTVFRDRRVVMARLGIEGVVGDDDDIPFTELPRLGGPATLRGYRNARFRDKVAMLGTIEYRYPIHNLVSGLVFVESGSVGRSLRDIVSGPRNEFQVGVGGGFVAHTLQDFVLRVELAYGEDFRLFISTDPLAAFRGRRKEL